LLNGDFNLIVAKVEMDSAKSNANFILDVKSKENDQGILILSSPFIQGRLGFKLRKGTSPRSLALLLTSSTKNSPSIQNIILSFVSTP